MNISLPSGTLAMSARNTLNLTVFGKQLFHGKTEVLAEFQGDV